MRGNITSTTDPNGAVTSNSITYCSGGGYVPQTMTQSKGWQSRTFNWKYSWDCPSGLLIGASDPAWNNGVRSQRIYSYDILGRNTSVEEGASVTRTTATAYSLTSTSRGSLATTPLQITITRSGSSGPTMVETQSFDTHGTMVSDTTGDTSITRLSSRPVSGDHATYEAVSNPQFSTGDATAGWTVTKRDTRGRVIETDHLSGASQPYPWGSNGSTPQKTTTSYAGGYIITAADESNHSRQFTVDGAGRLKNVIEDPGGLNYSTGYSLDVANRVTGVTQGSQSRTFVYDSLGQIVKTINPETATTTWTYDPAGNPLTRTDARNVTTTYGFDDLGRLRTKIYSDGTPTATWCYDGDNNATESVTRAFADVGGSTTVAWSCSGAPSGGSSSNMSTRLTMTNAQTSPNNTTYSYTSFDELGQPLASQEQVNGSTYGFTYTWYSSLGQLNTQTYLPTSRTLTWSYDTSWRQTGVQDATTPYGSVSAFWPNGAPHTLVMGASGSSQLTQASAYDYRQRPTSLALSKASGAINSLGYNWYPNSNLNTETIANGALASVVTQTFSYDNVNRVTGASETGNGTGWSQSFGYDGGYGNRSLTSGYNPYTAGTPTTQTFSNNKVSGWSYDAAGNLLTPSGMLSTTTAAYDGESRISTITDSATPPVQLPVKYYYDADGRRAMKAVCPSGTSCSATASGAQITTWVYDQAGSVAAQNGSSNGSTGTEYLFTDHLGSTRTMVEASTGTVHCYDYTPFGQELGSSQSSRGPCYEQLTYPSAAQGSVNDKFTGQERDAETGLDNYLARSYSPAQGRFTSPDPLGTFVADPSNPQSWNMYAYVGNNPLTFVDPTGTDAGIPGPDDSCLDGPFDCGGGDVDGPFSTGGAGQSPPPALPPFGNYPGQNQNSGVYGGQGGNGFLLGGPGLVPSLAGAGIGEEIIIGGLGAVCVGSGVCEAAAAGAAAGVAVFTGGYIIYNRWGGTRDRRREGNNVTQNKDFEDAVRVIEKAIGKKLSLDQIRRLHDKISKKGLNKKSIIEVGIGLFG